MNLNYAIRTDVTEEMFSDGSTLKRAVRLTKGPWSLLICFYAAGKFAQEIVCGSLSHTNGDWHGMNNLKHHGHGPGQVALWSHCDSGVMLAARWFLDLHSNERREEREAAATRKQGIVLRGGTGEATGPLFKLPAA